MFDFLPQIFCADVASGPWVEAVAGKYWISWGRSDENFSSIYLHKTGKWGTTAVVAYEGLVGWYDTYEHAEGQLLAFLLVFSLSGHIPRA